MKVKSLDSSLNLWIPCWHYFCLSRVTEKWKSPNSPTEKTREMNTNVDHKHEMPIGTKNTDGNRMNQM